MRISDWSSDVCSSDLLKVPVGTKVSDLIALAGGPTVQPYALIDGGPMMGKLTSPQATVTKTTGGIIVLPVQHSLVRSEEHTAELQSLMRISYAVFFLQQKNHDNTNDQPTDNEQ